LKLEKSDRGGPSVEQLAKVIARWIFEQEKAQQRQVRKLDR
jgi:hypothetical protein